MPEEDKPEEWYEAQYFSGWGWTSIETADTAKHAQQCLESLGHLKTRVVKVRVIEVIENA